MEKKPKLLGGGNVEWVRHVQLIHPPTDHKQGPSGITPHLEAEKGISEGAPAPLEAQGRLQMVGMCYLWT